jgi:hypothetical protein
MGAIRFSMKALWNEGYADNMAQVDICDILSEALVKYDGLRKAVGAESICERAKTSL